MRKRVEIFANNVRIALEDQHRRAAWLAEMSGVKPPNLSRLLKGEGNPTIETMQAIADALDLDLNDLLKPSEESDAAHHWFDKDQLRDEAEMLKTKLKKLNSIVHSSLNADELRGAIESRNVVEDRLSQIRGRLEFLTQADLDKQLKLKRSQDKQSPEISSQPDKSQLEELERLKAFEKQIIDKAGPDVLKALQNLDRPTVIGLRLGLELPDEFEANVAERPPAEAGKASQHSPRKKRSGT